MQEHYFSWIAREEKSVYSKDLEYIIGGIAFVIFIFCVLIENYFVIPIVIFGAFILIFSMRKDAQCITYVIDKKGMSVGDKTYLWKDIYEYNIMDDPGIKGRLIVKTNSLYGTLVCPVYDEDMENIGGLMKHYKTKYNEDLYIPLTEVITRLF